MQDPLQINVPLVGVDTDLPLLPEGDYSFQIKESSADPNKDKTGLNWNLKLGLAAPATAVDGRQINPDFPVFAVFALQAREDSKDTDAFRRSLGEAVDAIFGTTKENRPDFSAQLLQSAQGKLVTAHVVIDEYMGKKNNKVKRLKKQAA